MRTDVNYCTTSNLLNYYFAQLVLLGMSDIDRQKTSSNLFDNHFNINYKR